MADRERLNNSLRLYDSELSSFKVNESEVKSKVREKTALESRIKEWREDIANFTAQQKAGSPGSDVTECQWLIGSLLDRTWMEKSRMVRLRLSSSTGSGTRRRLSSTPSSDKRRKRFRTSTCLSTSWKV